VSKGGGTKCTRGVSTLKDREGELNAKGKNKKKEEKSGKWWGGESGKRIEVNRLFNRTELGGE